MYMYIHIHIYIYIMCVCVCVYSANTHTHVCACVHTYTHTPAWPALLSPLPDFLFVYFFPFFVPSNGSNLDLLHTHTHTRACVHTYTHTCVTRIPCCDSATAATMKANPMITISPLPDFLFIYFFLIFFTAKPMINIPPLCDIFVFLRTREMVVLTSRATQDYFKNKTLQLFLTTPSRREIVVPTRRAIKAATKWVDLFHARQVSLASPSSSWV